MCIILRLGYFDFYISTVTDPNPLISISKSVFKDSAGFSFGTVPRMKRTATEVPTVPPASFPSGESGVSVESDWQDTSQQSTEMSWHQIQSQKPGTTESA